MTPDLLRRCVDAYGSSSGLALRLRVNPATVRRWLACKSAIPGWLGPELAKILMAQAIEWRADSDVSRNQAAECERLARLLTHGPSCQGGSSAASIAPS
jgi:hypothetical protein